MARLRCVGFRVAKSVFPTSLMPFAKAICVCIYIYIHTHIYVCIDTHPTSWMPFAKAICVFICMCIYIYVYIDTLPTCLGVYIYIHIYIYVYIYTYTDRLGKGEYRYTTYLFDRYICGKDRLCQGDLCMYIYTHVYIYVYIDTHPTSLMPSAKTILFDPHTPYPSV